MERGMALFNDRSEWEGTMVPRNIVAVEGVERWEEKVVK
jgi:hypothetical protein